MAKQEIYWLKHDGNFRRTQAALTMRSIYGSEGYGWYWMLIEMMREAEGYKLSITGKYSIQGIAKELEADQAKINEFIADCVNEFNLFESDGESIWSAALNEKMAAYNEVVEKKREAARERWKNN